MHNIEREAQACIRFAELVQDDREAFTVPEIYLEASGKDVLTAEFMHGTAVTKIPDLSQDDRDWVGTQILRLCLRELMEWRFMQTDPNWTNFLYNKETQKLELLDFGASREYPERFITLYTKVLNALDYPAATFPVTKVDLNLDAKKPAHRFLSETDEVIYTSCKFDKPDGESIMNTLSNYSSRRAQSLPKRACRAATYRPDVGR